MGFEGEAGAAARKGQREAARSETRATAEPLRGRANFQGPSAKEQSGRDARFQDARRKTQDRRPLRGSANFQVPSAKERQGAWEERGADQARGSLAGHGPRVSPVATCLRPSGAGDKRSILLSHRSHPSWSKLQAVSFRPFRPFRCSSLTELRALRASPITDHRSPITAHHPSSSILHLPSAVPSVFSVSSVVPFSGKRAARSKKPPGSARGIGHRPLLSRP